MEQLDDLLQRVLICARLAELPEERPRDHGMGMLGGEPRSALTDTSPEAVAARLTEYMQEAEAFFRAGSILRGVLARLERRASSGPALATLQQALAKLEDDTLSAGRRALHQVEEEAVRRNYFLTALAQAVTLASNDRFNRSLSEKSSENLS